MKKPDFGRAEVLRCVLQSLFAAGFILLAFTLMNLFDNTLWIASLGASAFIAFTFPAAKSARPHILIGGYVCGTFWGLLGAWVNLVINASGDAPEAIACAVIVVFCAMLSMNLLNLEHPPSVALAIGIVQTQRPLLMAVAGIASILLLCLMRRAALPLFREKENPR